MILAGCTSSDSSSSGGSTAVPANAVTITSSNSKNTVTNAVATANIALSAVGAEAVQTPQGIS